MNYLIFLGALNAMKTKNHRFLLMILFIFPIFTSCEEDESEWFPVEGSGVVQTEQRPIAAFNKLRSGIVANILIIERNNAGIEISAQSNLLSLIETEVNNGVLYISFGKHAVSTDSTISIIIFTDKIDEMTISGSGSVNSTLAISANLRCSGALDKVSVKLSGTGTINLSEMSVKQADVKITGSGNVSLNVAHNLNVDIMGAGIVYYRGLPTIQKNITGTGQIIWQD